MPQYLIPLLIPQPLYYCSIEDTNLVIHVQELVDIVWHKVRRYFANLPSRLTSTCSKLDDLLQNTSKNQDIVLLRVGDSGAEGWNEMSQDRNIVRCVHDEIETGGNRGRYKKVIGVLYFLIIRAVKTNMDVVRCVLIELLVTLEPFGIWPRPFKGYCEEVETLGKLCLRACHPWVHMILERELVDVVDVVNRLPFHKTFDRFRCRTLKPCSQFYILYVGVNMICNKSYVTYWLPLIVCTVQHAWEHLLPSWHSVVGQW